MPVAQNDAAQKKLTAFARRAPPVEPGGQTRFISRPDTRPRWLLCVFNAPDSGAFFWYDGHAVSLWCKSTRGVVADEPQSDSQGLHREVQARGRDSEIVA